MEKFVYFALGNIGQEYDETRHNIGFKIADAFVAQFENSNFVLDRYGAKAEVKIKGRNITIIKPSTFMNLSGKAVKYWLTQLNIPIENSMTILDDLSLEFGKIRIKKMGSDGGHNGLKSIQESLGQNVYPRLRFGIGSDFALGKQVDYVLGKWTENENIQLETRIKICIDILKQFPLIGLDNTMNQFNNK